MKGPSLPGAPGVPRKRGGLLSRGPQGWGVGEGEGVGNRSRTGLTVPSSLSSEVEMTRAQTWGRTE